MPKALADLFGPELHEVGNLDDVDRQARDGSSGDMVYSHVLDFTDLATPEVAAKIVRRFGSLQVEVNLNFVDDVRDGDWPNWPARAPLMGLFFASGNGC